LHEGDRGGKRVLSARHDGAHREPPRFDLGEIEHLVHEAQQVAAAHSDARQLLPLRIGQCARQSEVEQLRVAEDCVEGRPELVGHDREKLRLCVTRRFGFGARALLLLELSRAFFRLFAVRDVAERHELHCLAVPLGVDDTELGDGDAGAPLDDVDLGGLTRHDRKPERRSHEIGDRATKQPLRGGVREPDYPVPIDDDDTVGETLDDLPQTMLR